MNIDHRLVVALRGFLVLLLALLVVLQTFSVPGTFAYMARQNPEEAYLRWPLTAVAVLLIGCAQVVLVATWRLLTLVERDEIFSRSAFRWVDAIVVAIFVVWLVFGSMTGLVAFTADDPGVAMLMLLLASGITVFGLLMLVMRALLHRATTLRAEMDAVI